MKVAPGFGLALPSLPSRGAWIEIADALNDNVGVFVAPLPGSVDRNVYGPDGRDVVQVAPLAGSVDRNAGFCSAGSPGVGRSPRGERG